MEYAHTGANRVKVVWTVIHRCKNPSRCEEVALTPILMRLFHAANLILVATLALCDITIQAQEESEPQDHPSPRLFEDLPSLERLEELKQVAKEMIKYKPTRNSPVAAKDIERLLKLQERVKPSEYEIVWSLYDEIVEERKANKTKEKSGDSDKGDKSKLETNLNPMPNLKPMEEMVVLGTRFDGVPIHPDEFNVGDIYHMRILRKQANYHYSKGDYTKAYPLLLELSKRGFKDSQSRLAYILFHGTEGVPKSNYRALGWLGAAADGRTEPIFRVLLNRHLREVPFEQRERVASVIDSYREEFSFPEHMKCGTNHQFNHSRSRIKKVYCEFKLEQIANACQGLCWAHKVNARKDS